MKYKDLYRFITGGCFFIVSLALLILAKQMESFAEWYAQKIYPMFVSTVGRISRIFPFSVSEVLLYIIVIWFTIAVVRLVYKVITKREGKKAVSGLFSKFVLGLGIAFFLYSINCGINYERVSFSESVGIKTTEYSARELTQVCRWLTDKVNISGGKVERDEDGVMQLAEGEQEGAVFAMEQLGDVYVQLDGYYPNPKGLLNPWILSVQNLTGIYSPFTIEANYNSAITPYNIPFTACHELSHLSGFMQEQEANFIAWLACSESSRPDFNYSADLMGWIYCMNVLERVDRKAYEEIRAELSPEVQVDLKANNEFWKKYDTRIAEVSNKINDTYLKANGQQDGVKSYDRMVDLIVTYYYIGK